MKVEVTAIYLPITEDLNLSVYQILKRKHANDIIKTMAQTLVEKYDIKPDTDDIEKVIFTLTANEEHIMNITKVYVPKQS